ncbi:MAG: hypothetical protein EA391_02275 [Balneolaceae bacterium]|nr:MAG: hypothetical protein EA391_02275 [Balneolaceae bacterium]
MVRNNTTHVAQLLIAVFILIGLLASCSDSSTPVFTMEASVSPQEGGTVTPSFGEFEEGDTVEVKFTPEESWFFVSWQGDITGTENPVVVTIDSDLFFTAVAEQITHPLDIETTGEGSVDVAVIEPKSTEYPDGSVLELTAKPDNGWVFLEWQGDLEGNDNPQTLTMDEAKNVTAVFVRDKFEIEIHTDGEGQVDIEVIEEPAKDVYPFETVLQLTAKASDGWEFIGWEGDLDGNENPVTFTVDDNVSITAVFERQNFQLNIETEGEGTVDAMVVDDPSKTAYPFETVVELTAEANEGWEFTRWEGDLSGSNNPEEILMDGDKNITAVFSREEFNVNVTIEGEGDVDIEIVEEPAKQSFPFETVIELTAVAANGWEFSGWGGELDGSENPQQLVVKEEIEVTAIFERQEFELSVSTEGNGSVSADPSGTTHPFETVVELTANPDDGWQFSQWDGDLSGSNNPEEIVIDGNKEVIAVFEEIKYTLSVSTQGEGSIDLEPDKNEYSENEQVVVPAVPNRGWEFIEWKGDLSGSSNPETITMSSDKSITAVFATLPTVSTSNISNIEVTTARAGGNVSDNGGAPVTERGICFNTSGNPDLSDTCRSSGSGTGSFDRNLSNLTAGETYYVRAYATNAVGTAFGSERNFRPGVISHGYINGVTPSNTSQFRDREYLLVEANWGGPGGNSVWLGQNLGSTGPPQRPTETNAGQAGWYFQFNESQGYFHDGNNVVPFMNRYMGSTTDWESGNDPCNLALGNDWRLPTSEELDNYRTASQSNGALGSGNRTDAYNSDLRLHAAGAVNFQGQLGQRGNVIYLYSSNQSSSTEAEYLFVDGRASFLGDNASKATAFPVRCIRD